MFYIFLLKIQRSVIAPALRKSSPKRQFSLVGKELCLSVREQNRIEQNRIVYFSLSQFIYNNRYSKNDYNMLTKARVKIQLETVFNFTLSYTVCSTLLCKLVFFVFCLNQTFFSDHQRNNKVQECYENFFFHFCFYINNIINAHNFFEKKI